MGDLVSPENINTRRNVGRRIKMEKNRLKKSAASERNLDKLIKSNLKKF